jgi:hypothetical protein
MSLFAAALDFVNDGLHRLANLQVSSNGYEKFSSYDEFYKVELSLELLAKRFGPAGDGQQYHRIVTQGGANADNIPPAQLQNTDNIIRLQRRQRCSPRAAQFSERMFRSLCTFSNARRRYEPMKCFLKLSTLYQL